MEGELSDSRTILGLGKDEITSNQQSSRLRNFVDNYLRKAPKSSNFTMASSQVSADLIWEIVRSNNSFLVKRKASGGVQFSRDNLNLTNKHARKWAGFVNDKAIGVVPGEKNAVKVLSKKTSAANKPVSAITETTYSGGKSARKTYVAVAQQTAKSNYRADLRQAAVARASAVRHSYKEPKPTPEPKPRGAKAKKAAE
ncbi:ribosomal L28e protein family-domain-containing protein [Xylaria bambusicola]|uniref:ribosomal L28e protein family-domain-containing protein n=1 Tax=Xylaria bambusicola TaxID=326684 RepID=UPI002007AD62|nr:ribosomal L28e protein family-domain-containing protein [Xylaria bambusicola]KAI0512693.1 ribosomal L28e protein family-domain-containing protein [Xylaria bambusicola]